MHPGHGLDVVAPVPEPRKPTAEADAIDLTATEVLGPRALVPLPET